MGFNFTLFTIVGRSMHFQYEYAMADQGGLGVAPAPLLWGMDERVPSLLKDLNSQRLGNHFPMDRRAIGNNNFHISYYLNNVLVTMASVQSSQVCSPCSPVATLTTAIIVRDICRVSGFIDVNFSTNVVEIWYRSKALHEINNQGDNVLMSN